MVSFDVACSIILILRLISKQLELISHSVMVWCVAPASRLLPGRESSNQKSATIISCCSVDIKLVQPVIYRDGLSNNRPVTFLSLPLPMVQCPCNDSLPFFSRHVSLSRVSLTQRKAELNDSLKVPI